jgi:hypothetical protein
LKVGNASLVAAALIGSPLLAQAEPPPEDAEDAPLVIDLMPPPPTAVQDEECEREADAARITGEIVVCRSLGEEGDGYYDPQRVEDKIAESTLGPIAPDVDTSGIQLPTEGSLITVTVTAKFGDPPEQPLIIDIESLPEAPPGSDADRIAKGLPLKP